MTFQILKSLVTQLYAEASLPDANTDTLAAGASQKFLYPEY